MHNGNLVYTTFKANHFSTISNACIDLGNNCLRNEIARLAYNPLEHLWDELGRRVHARPVQPNRLSANRQEWAGIPQSTSPLRFVNVTTLCSCNWCVRWPHPLLRTLSISLWCISKLIVLIVRFHSWDSYSPSQYIINSKD